MIDIPINEVYAYLEEVIAKKYKKVRNAAKKLIRVIVQDFHSAKGSIDDLVNKLDPEKDDLVTRSVKRFTSTLQVVMENFDMNFEVTINYKKLKDTFDFLIKFFRIYNENGKKWFPKIGKDFKEELKSLDLFMRKLFRNNGKLDRFIKNKYKKARNAEKISEDLEKLTELSLKVSEGKLKIDTLKDKTVNSSDEIKNLEEELVQLEHNDLIIKERKYFRDQNKIKQRIKLDLSRIKKSLRKFKKAVENGHYNPRFITRREIKQYVKNPFKSLINDGPEYPKLRALLENLADSLEIEDIQLKEDKKEKTLEVIKNIKENYSFKPLLIEYEDLRKKRKNIKNLIIEKGISDKREEIKREISDLTTTRSHTKSDLNHYKEVTIMMLDKMKILKKNIENKINELSKEQVKILLLF